MGCSEIKFVFFIFIYFIVKQTGYFVTMKGQFTV